MGSFKLIYADPPWTYRDKCNDGERGAGRKYQTMTVQDICRLPVWDLADPDSCLLAMWWVPTQPLEALKVVEAWGFRLMTMKGFTWHKTNSGTISVPFAQPSRYGVVKIGSRLVGGGDGTINVPTANRATAGVVKAGADLDFGMDGTSCRDSCRTAGAYGSRCCRFDLKVE